MRISERGEDDSDHLFLDAHWLLVYEKYAHNVSVSAAAWMAT